MKKTDKKIEKAIVAALTDVCDLALVDVPGFKWLTHLVDYQRFPESLVIVCVFDTQAQLASVLKQGKDDDLRRLIKDKLDPVISVKGYPYQVKFDTEEACELDHGGKWHERL